MLVTHLHGLPSSNSLAQDGLPARCTGRPPVPQPPSWSQLPLTFLSQVCHREPQHRGDEFALVFVFEAEGTEKTKQF